MKQQSVETPDMETLGAEAMTKTERFFEENGKKITWAIFALFILAAAIFGYRELVMEPTESRAAAAIYPSQVIFEAETPNYETALEGDASSAGFLSVIAEYGSTASGNLARHYAGVCYMKMGEYDKALSYLTQYKAQKGSAAQIIYAQNIGLQGDIAVEKGNYTSAVALFKKAADSSENPLTTPLYLRKAGMAAQAAGNMAEARELYESVVKLYPSTAEARTAEKYLGTVK